MRWAAEKKRWAAQVRWVEGGKRRTAWAGYHQDEVAAARAYNAKAREVRGPLAKLNELV